MSPFESVDQISEEELHEMFRRRRPEANAFRAGIDERIDARADEEESHADEGGEEDGAGSFVQSKFWGRAAAFLPFDPSGGTLAGSSVGGKSFSTVLALPVLVLGTAIGGFFAGTRSLRRSTADALPIGENELQGPSGTGSSDPHAKRGERLTSLVPHGSLVALLVAGLLGGRVAIDVLMAGMVVSMAGLVLSVRGLARMGTLNRDDATKLGVGSLMAVFLGCFNWFHGFNLPDESSLGVGWPASVLLIGASVCLVVGGRRASAVRMVLLGLFFVGVLNIAGVTRSSPESLRSQLAGMLETGDLDQWEDAAAICSALVAVGAELPDMERVRQRVSQAALEGADILSMEWTAAHEMGLVSDRDWQVLAKSEEWTLDRLQEDGRYSTLSYNQCEIPMLLAAREVTPEQIDRIAREVLDSWPADGDHGAPEDALTCVRALEQLGREDLVEGLRGRAHELLRAYWVSSSKADFFGIAGGFTSHPENYGHSFDDETLAGVELMARFGVPDGIDLSLLRSYLRNKSRTWVAGELMPYLFAKPRAALLRLREQIGMPKRTWLETVLAERLLIASVLVVLLCLIAIRLAPPVVDTGGGAQP